MKSLIEGCCLVVESDEGSGLALSTLSAGAPNSTTSPTKHHNLAFMVGKAIYKNAKEKFHPVIGPKIKNKVQKKHCAWVRHR